MVNINNPYGFGTSQLGSIAKKPLGSGGLEKHDIKKPSELTKALETGFKELKEVGKKSDQATENFAMGMGNVAQVAFDTTTWHTLIEVSSATQQKLVGAFDQLIKTPL